MLLWGCCRYKYAYIYIIEFMKHKNYSANKQLNLAPKILGPSFPQKSCCRSLKRRASRVRSHICRIHKTGEIEGVVPTLIETSRFQKTQPDSGALRFQHSQPRARISVSDIFFIGHFQVGKNKPSNLPS